MFGRRRPPRISQGASPVALPGLRVHPELALVADPDYANIQRQRAIFLQTGKQLQGFSGQVVGYDRGDPANSLTQVLPGGPLPTAAIAQVGKPADQPPVAVIQDVVMSDPALDPYQAMLWNRISR